MLVTLGSVTGYTSVPLIPVYSGYCFKPIIKAGAFLLFLLLLLVIRKLLSAVADLTLEQQKRPDGNSLVPNILFVCLFVTEPWKQKGRSQ